MRKNNAVKLARKWLFAAVFAAVVALCGMAFTGCVRRLEPETPNEIYTEAYPTAARHGYDGEVTGTVKRVAPAVSDGGLSCGYPVYGEKLDVTGEEKSAVIAEAVSLCARATTPTGGSYDKMDKDGYLYLSDGTPVTDKNGAPRKLYKHSAADSMYYGAVPDSEQAVVKRMSFAPRQYSSSYNVTGLYAPAGEVIKLEMSKADMTATGGVTVHIGQALYNGKNNNIWAARDLVRMPVVLNTMIFNEANSTFDAERGVYTCYVGSYLGGPIYVRNAAARFTLTVSGGLEYRHFVLGYTTEERFDALKTSKVPYFDLEVWDLGVLHSGPLRFAENFSYAELYDAAVLWEKVSLVSTRVRAQNIVTFYDPFVAAGAAVAFPGQGSTNCPVSWMNNALDAKAITESGAWGVFHEYNHNFQGWGLAGGGEVTNNALSLVEYSAFTDVSSARTISDGGETGLSGWNAYTSANYALRRLNGGYIQSTDQISVYATLLHNLGAENFMTGVNASGATKYYSRLCELGLDMTYFFKELCAADPGDAAVEAVKAKRYPAFVPVSSLYQTGRSLTTAFGTEYTETQRPYRIPFGKPFDFDLSRYAVADGKYYGGSIEIPDGFSFSVKDVSQPESGSVVKKSGGVYTYTPGQNARSGKIFVTLKITKDDGAFSVDDVKLALEFVQSRELGGTVLDRTVYAYDALPYATALDAYNAGYAGYSSKTEEKNVNPTQNSNTDIWGPDPGGNAVMEVRGKLIVPSDGDYRIALRGRHSAALNVSADGGKTYASFAHRDHKTNNNTWALDDPQSYVDVMGCKAGDEIYFKETLLVDYSGAFIGLGFGRIENGEAKISYASAYNPSYAEDEPFTSDYLFRRTVSYGYDGSEDLGKGTLVSVSGYAPWSGYSATLDELCDGDDTNYIHSNRGAENDITPDHPFVMTVDLGKEVTANSLVVYGEPSRLYIPKDFKVYVGNDPNALKEVKSVTDAPVVNGNVTVSFTPTAFRYYRIEVTATAASANPAGAKYIAFRRINVLNSFVLSDGRLVPLSPDSMTMRGVFTKKPAPTPFGRVYSASQGASVEFAAECSRIAIVSTSERLPVTVYVDGARMPDIGAVSGSGVGYLSEEFTSGVHNIKIVCDSECEIDSFSLFAE